MSSDTRKSILHAAKRRFAHYGYSKTAMSEIAQDADMSVGNLYRFFKNKEAIAIAGVESSLLEKAEAGEKAMAAETTASGQLAAYLMARMRYTHGMICNTPHLYELMKLISERHGELIGRFEKRAIEQIAAIIGHGIKQGEFRAMDAPATAEAIYYATTKFNVPLFMNEPIEQLERKLKALIELLYRGLKK